MQLLAILPCRYLVPCGQNKACDKLFGASRDRFGRSDQTNLSKRWFRIILKCTRPWFLLLCPGLCQRLWHLCRPYLCHLCLWEHPWRSAGTRRLFKVSQSCAEMQCSQHLPATPRSLVLLFQRLLFDPINSIPEAQATSAATSVSTSRLHLHLSLSLYSPSAPTLSQSQSL